MTNQLISPFFSLHQSLAYMSGFLSLPAVNRRSVFSQLGCLLYVFDVESPEFSRVDMIWFSRVISAVLDVLDQSEE